jgi:hypothetical protein
MIRNKIASNVNKGSESRNVKLASAQSAQYTVDKDGNVNGDFWVKPGEYFTVVIGNNSNFTGKIYIMDNVGDVTAKITGLPAPTIGSGYSGCSFQILPGTPDNPVYQVGTKLPSQLPITYRNNCGQTESGTLRVGSPPTDDDDDDRHGRKGDSAHDTERVSPTGRR